jgi:hypothetical protein
MNPDPASEVVLLPDEEPAPDEDPLPLLLPDEEVVLPDDDPLPDPLPELLFAPDEELPGGGVEPSEIDSRLKGFAGPPEDVAVFAVPPP